MNERIKCVSSRKISKKMALLKYWNYTFISRFDIKCGRSSLCSNDVRIGSAPPPPPPQKKKKEIFKNDKTLKNITCIWYKLYVFSQFLAIVLRGLLNPHWKDNLALLVNLWMQATPNSFKVTQKIQYFRPSKEEITLRTVLLTRKFVTRMVVTISKIFGRFSANVSFQCPL